MQNPRFNVLVGMILTAAILRLVPHPPNFTPIGAMALFAGAQFSRKGLAFCVPLAAMLLSDLVIGLHRGMPLVYGCFALTVGLGFWLRAHRKPHALIAAGVLSAVLFYAITNFGVWAGGTLYPRNITGLLACYTAALPFLNNMLLGNLFYGALLFGTFWLLQQRFTVLRELAAA